MKSCSGVEMTAWLMIGDEADINYHVSDDGLVEFHIGGRDGFDLAATEVGLGNLVNCAQEALQTARSATACDESL